LHVLLAVVCEQPLVAGHGLFS